MRVRVAVGAVDVSAVVPDVAVVTDGIVAVGAVDVVVCTDGIGGNSTASSAVSGLMLYLFTFPERTSGVPSSTLPLSNAISQ